MKTADEILDRASTKLFANWGVQLAQPSAIRILLRSIVVDILDEIRGSDGGTGRVVDGKGIVVANTIPIRTK